MNERNKKNIVDNFLFRRSDESLSAMAARDQPVGPLTALLDTLADTATPLFTRDGLSRSFIDIAAHRPIKYHTQQRLQKGAPSLPPVASSSGSS